MAVISEVKCGRCDRRYSGFRSRCPYCGARRNKRGKHADEADNEKAKLIIGILLLGLIIAATILLLTNLPDKVDPVAETDAPAISTDAEPTYSDGEDVDTVINTDIPEVLPSPSPSVVVEVAEVQITSVTGPTADLTISKIGASEKMGFITIPETTGKQATWASSNEAVFMVQTDGTITAIGRGSAKLTCTVDGVVGTCIVRVRG